MEVTVLAPAKINLTLDVTGRREEDGYHLIETVMQSITLYERITVRETESGGITLDVDDERVPADERNTAFKAARAFFESAGLPEGNICIRIEKQVPMQAGLGGGSADAAGVLAALNVLTDARLDMDTLCEAGARVGADVPFCVQGGAALCTGTGTILTPIPSMPACFVVVAKPACGVSTAEAYRRIDAADLIRRPHTSVMVDAVCAGELNTIGRKLCNVFDEAMALPEVDAICSIMRDHRTLGCQMSGSGSAVFGLFEHRADARQCADALRKMTDQVFVCAPCGHGPQVEE